MGGRCFYFAGGGTGGHIYPALAVAERIINLDSEAKIHFFCSSRDIDSKILSAFVCATADKSKTSFKYTALPASGFSVRPDRIIKFCASFIDSFRIAKRAFTENKNAVVIGIGGFVSAPVCLAAHKLKIPIVLLNVDIVPGRANKHIARWADKIFVQFEDTKQCFAPSAFLRKQEEGEAKVDVVGCPLRSGFDNPQPEKAKNALGLERGKKILLITGASSGSENINNAICSLLDKLDSFADDWQIVHLAGRANFESVQKRYAGAKISNKVVDYFDDMPDLLSAADLVIGRSGAVSVAEYAAAGVPSICIPYPYHKDRHQYLNAGKLVDVGAAVIVDDTPQREDPSRLSVEPRQGMTKRLWAELEELMKNNAKRKKMAENCKAVANKQAASKIAERLLNW